MDRIGEAMRATQYGWEAIKPHAHPLRRSLPAQQKALVEELRVAGYHDIAHGYKMDTLFEQQGASAGFVSQIIKLHYPLLAARHGWGQAAKALKVVYHGTAADFNVFSHDGAPTFRHPSRKLGFVFTESAEEAGRPDFWYPVT